MNRIIFLALLLTLILITSCGSRSAAGAPPQPQEASCVAEEPLIAEIEETVVVLPAFVPPPVIAPPPIVVAPVAVPPPVAAPPPAVETPPVVVAAPVVVQQAIVEAPLPMPPPVMPLVIEAPAAVEAAPVVAPLIEIPSPAPEIVAEVFDPSNVPEALYESTILEVRVFIDSLNRVIQSRNFESWRASLSDDFFGYISSPEHLRRISEMNAMRARGITLRSAEDFFQHVVVPSRANSRVDEIEFIDENRVKAFTVTTNRAGQTQRLRLYDLEFANNTWIIIN